jgi:hypothetical protein
VERLRDSILCWVPRRAGWVPAVHREPCS